MSSYHVGSSFTRSTHSSSTTPTDSEILELLGDLEDTTNIPPRKRNLEASLQAATTGAC